MAHASREGIEHICVSAPIHRYIGFKMLRELLYRRTFVQSSALIVAGKKSVSSGALHAYAFRQSKQ